MLSRKERDRQLRRSDILKAAEHIFALKGYYKATIRDIAKEAQYATGTVYLHFKDKDALYFALLEEKMKSLLSTIEGKIKQTKDAREKLEIFVQEGLGFFEKNQDFLRLFISEEVDFTTEKKLFKSPIGLQMREATRSLMEEAQEQGVVSSDFDPGQIADIFMSMTRVVTLSWLQGENRKENNSIINSSDLILRLFLNGAAK